MYQSKREKISKAIFEMLSKRSDTFTKEEKNRLIAEMAIQFGASEEMATEIVGFFITTGRIFIEG